MRRDSRALGQRRRDSRQGLLAPGRRARRAKRRLRRFPRRRSCAPRACSSEAAGRARFATSYVRRGASRWETIPGLTDETCPAGRINGLVEELGLRGVDYIKLNIEGAELRRSAEPR